MENREWNFVDKSKWGTGVWQNEPDKVQFVDEETGLPCLIVRNQLGALCGYVGVDSSHAAFERNYDEVDVNVHGGLTFSDFCSPGNDEHGICHIVEDGENDRVWWLGFDCAHGGDIVPSCFEYPILSSFEGKYGETYKDIAYVKAEIKNLAKQLKEQC